MSAVVRSPALLASEEVGASHALTMPGRRRWKCLPSEAIGQYLFPPLRLLVHPNFLRLVRVLPHALPEITKFLRCFGTRSSLCGPRSPVHVRRLGARDHFSVSLPVATNFLDLRGGTFPLGVPISLLKRLGVRVRLRGIRSQELIHSLAVVLDVGELTRHAVDSGFLLEPRELSED